ncbi:MAG: HIT family protein [Candidatus Methylopumilus sp.]|jgi:diadenosine tetraphosphate (Ap4A) HIT family hydrolase|nr:HIT family protein [Betaproteobacteria bacterium]
MTCAICNSNEGEIIWTDNTLRVVLLDHPDYKGYCRVELINHQKEMTDLDESLQFNIMRCVFKVEEILRKIFNPDKINLASLGNKTPHIHWHIIPRFKEDPHFPNSHWGEKLREGLHQAISETEKNELIKLLNQSLN